MDLARASHILGTQGRAVAEMSLPEMKDPVPGEHQAGPAADGEGVPSSWGWPHKSILPG